MDKATEKFQKTSTNLLHDRLYMTFLKTETSKPMVKSSYFMPKIARKSSPKSQTKAINVSITKGRISIDKKAPKHYAASKPNMSLQKINRTLYDQTWEKPKPLDKVLAEKITEREETKDSGRKEPYLGNLGKNKLKKVQNEDLTPFDFINMIRTDPEMQDEFCYLNRRKNPYDFKIVEFNERDNNEYMTISSRGITHYIKGVGEFIRIEDWEKEARQYDRLLKIQFFREYKIWKTFFIWKKTTRKNAMRKCQSVLVKNLLMLDSHLQKPLIEIRDISEQMTHLEFMELELNEPVDYLEFEAKQDRYRDGQLQYQFMLIETQIKDILAESCKNSLQDFKLLHRIPNEDDDQQPLLIGDESKKDMPYTQEATIKTHYKRLRKYTRLVDYLYLTSKLSMVNSSTLSFSNQLREFKPQISAQLRSNTWFVLKISVQDDRLEFKPNQDQIKYMINQVVTKGIEAVCERSKYFSHKEELKHFLDREVEPCEFMDIKYVVNSDSMIRQTMEIFQESASYAISLMQNYYDYISPFMGIYQQNINLALLEQEIDIPLFQSLILKYQQQDIQLNVIEPRVEVGMFQIDATKLKELIKNCAQDCLQSLYQQIPEILLKKSQEYLNVIVDLNHKLNWTIHDSSNHFVEYFVNYCEYVNKANNLQDDLKIQLDSLNGLFALVTHFKIKITETHKIKMNDSNNNMTSMKKKLDEAASQYDQNLAKSAKKLEKTVPDLQEKIRKIDERLQHPSLDDKNSNINKLVSYLDDLNVDIAEMIELTQKTNKFQKALSFEVTDFEKIVYIQEQFIVIERLWKGRQQFYDFLQKISNLHFLSLNYLEMENFMNLMKKTSVQCQKELEVNEVCKVYKTEVNTFVIYMDTIRPLLDPSLGDKEWFKIRKISQGLIPNDPEPFKNTKDPKYTFQFICEEGFTQLRDKYIEIALQASKEIDLEKQLGQLEQFWKDSKISVGLFRGNADCPILSNNQDMINRLDETILALNNIQASRFVEGIKYRVQAQLKQFVQLQELLDEWNEHQNNYLYLEPILNTNTSQVGLQKESAQFKKCEKTWKLIMKRAKDYPLCKSWVDEQINRQYLGQLKGNNKQFEQIQKALDDYLEKKREQFQRLCFLSNIELLKILSIAKTVPLMIPHLKKLFENVVNLVLDDDQTSALYMISHEGEQVQLKQCSMRGGEVEEWMHTLEESMHYSLKIATRQAIIGLENDERKEWIMKHCCQVTLTVDSIQWTRMAEDQYLIMEGVPEEEQDIQPIDEFVIRIVLDLDDAIYHIKQQISPIQRINLNALVTQDVHYRDVAQYMFEENIIKASDFYWIQQMKFYWEDENFFAKMVTSVLSYGYEFLGAFTRLVITPLTDRCWLTITNAFAQKLGANPAGPAGTGKTESCKDLAKVLGRYCLVFNCSDQVNVKMMEKLFTGIAATGSWTCLDEFNRIDIEVLSVVQSQLLTIREALLEQKTQFNFFGKQVSLNQYMGVFITFNPGYAGRSELPENLKVLFRPVAMMVPDYGMIAENLLYSEGFGKARELARKIQFLYKICSEQLSQQPHYDFGMRSVKSVLLMAAQLKQSDRSLSDLNVLIKALLDSNIPKYLERDKEIFIEIIKDLFPGQNLVQSVNPNMKFMVDQVLQESNLSGFEILETKLCQFWETIKVRFGVMLIGPAFSGKSLLLKKLQEILNRLKIKASSQPELNEFPMVETSTLNPKAITIEELYGFFEPATQTWNDGLASKLLREYTTRTEKDFQFWVVFDGPIDSFWVENMNSVLDDSMILCLSNGERIKLHSRMRIVFECNDLSQASPATISRCGMCYIGVDTLDPLTLIMNYIQKSDYKPEAKTLFIEQTKRVIPLLIPQVMTLTSFIKVTSLELVTKTMRFLEMMLEDIGYKRILQTANENNLRKAHTKIFVFSIYWGFGSHLDDESQDKFLAMIYPLFNPQDQIKTSILDTYLDFKYRQEGEYLAFQDLIPQFSYIKEKPYYEQIVPTKDTVTIAFLAQKFKDQKKHIYITGHTGIGKSINSLNAIKQLNNTLEVNMTFSSQTSPQFVQENLEYKLTQQRKQGKMMLLPPPGKDLCIFVDDVNLPNPEVWGSHPPLELLRQCLDQLGLYDKQGLHFKHMEPMFCMVVGAPPGGGRSEITSRFTRHFSVFNIQKTSDSIIQSIFNQIVRGYFKSNGFKNEITDMTKQLVSATLLLYKNISSSIFPTAEKSHYIFTLREVSKVFQGILLSKPQGFILKKNMAYLWAHESVRVFHDKLTNLEDQSKVLQEVQQLLLNYLNEKVENIGDIQFCDFLGKAPEVESRMYEPCLELSKLQEIISDLIKEENLPSMVLFQDAIKHIVRIARVLKLDKGHMVLVGMDGSGRRTLSRMACRMAGAVFKKLDISKKYMQKDFRADLFSFMFEAGTGNKHIMFLMNESDIVKECFMEDINNLINNGEISGLIGRDEFDRINIQLNEEAKVKKFPDAMSLFKYKLKANLHIVICLSPVGGKLAERFRKYPALMNAAYINWVLPWPDDALHQVASIFLDDAKMDGVPENQKEALCNLFVFVQKLIDDTCVSFYNQSKRKIYVTSKNYLDFVQYYKYLFDKLKDTMTSAKNKLTNGLNKLQEANSTIVGLKQKLVELQPILVQKTNQIKELIQKLTQDQLQANQVKKVVEAEANEINIQSEKIAILKAEADQILKEAQPILQGAIEQLDKLNRGDISEIKMNNNPHQLVKYTMECVAVLLEEKTDWDNIKKNILSDASLLTKLKSLRGENITIQTKEKLKKKLLGNPLFVPSEMKAINVAAKSICEWIHAVNNYTDVYREIQAKKDNCKQMDQELSAANKKLAEKQAELDEVVKKVQALEKSYSDSKAEKESLDNEIKQTEERLHRASQLTEGLAEEQVRWKEQAIQMMAEIDVLLGNAFLSAGSIQYHGPFSGTFRDTLMQHWIDKCAELRIPHSASYTLQKVMGNPVEIREWQQKGLSSDTISINNAIQVQNSTQYPLIIDPQNQACKWIKNMELENNLVVIKLNSESFQKSLEESVMLGRPMLIEDIQETIPSSLDHLLAKQYTVDNGKKLIKIGDESYQFNDNFKLFITTKLSNPHYLPEVFIKTQVLNFSVSKEGLQEKLLGDVLSFELPEDDKIRRELIVSIADDRLLLKKGEERILDLLTNSRGMILDDIELIESLKISKEIARAVSDKIVVSEKKQQELNRGMVLYEPLARRAVVLFFAITELNQIDPMYQFSLNYFSNLYKNIITGNTTEGPERIDDLIDNVTKNIYLIICRGLFNKHKQIFSFNLAIQISIQEKQTIKQSEFMYLITGVLETIPDFPYPTNASFSEKGWTALTHIAKKHKKYEEILFQLQQNTEAWNMYFDSPTIMYDDFPGEADPFQRLLLINLFKFEKTFFAIDNFIRDSLGEVFVQNINPTLEDVMVDTDYKTPLIYILSPGADPLMSILRYAKDQRIPSENLFIISLGQGQGPIAENAINQALKSGGWVILQNCHLGKSFMPTLEKRLEILQNADNNYEYNQEFRLILTSMPCDYFPVTILQNSMKLTCEPPRGIKNNLNAFYQTLTEERMQIEESKSNSFYKLTFAISLFHASMLERRKYGSIGFNKYYQFNDSDLEAAHNSLKNLLETFNYIPWDALRFIVGQINYGGRVTDEWDRRLLNSMLMKFCQEAVLKDRHPWTKKGDFHSPEVTQLPGYLDYISELPDEDPTDIFGLDQNANINFQYKESKTVISVIEVLQPKGTSTSGEGQVDDSTQKLLNKLQRQLPELLVSSKEVNVIDSLEVFLQLEIGKFNRLISTMKKSFEDLNKAQKGETMLSSALDQMFQQIKMNKVPSMWEKVGYPSLKPLGSWFEDFLQRVNFYSHWLNNYMQKSYWLPAMFYPQGFITSIIQNYARKMRSPIDKCSLRTQLVPNFEVNTLVSAPMDGCYIHGLYSEGFRFDVAGNKVNIEQQLPHQIFMPCPIIHFLPYQMLDRREEKLYMVPIYKTTIRDGQTTTTGQSTNFIIALSLPNIPNQDYWILQGSALFCQLDD